MLRQKISALPQRNLKKHFSSFEAVLKNQVRSLLRDGRARPNARQRRAAHRRQPDSRVNLAGPDITFCAPSSDYLCDIPSKKAWTHNEGCRFRRSVAHLRSARNDFPGPVGLDGYG